MPTSHSSWESPIKREITQQTSHFPFLRLPPELRNEIYNLVLPSHQRLKPIPSVPFISSVPALFLTSTQICLESVHIFYTTNTIRLRPRADIFAKPIYPVTALCPLIRNLDIDFLEPYFTRWTQCWRLEFELADTLARIVERCTELRTLRLRLPWSKSNIRTTNQGRFIAAALFPVLLNGNLQQGGLQIVLGGDGGTGDWFSDLGKLAIAYKEFIGSWSMEERKRMIEELVEVQRRMNRTVGIGLTSKKEEDREREEEKVGEKEGGQVDMLFRTLAPGKWVRQKRWAQGREVWWGRVVGREDDMLEHGSPREKGDGRTEGKRKGSNFGKRKSVSMFNIPERLDKRSKAEKEHRGSEEDRHDRTGEDMDLAFLYER